MGLVSRSINTTMFADGACDERHRDRPQPPSARRVAVGRHRFFLSLLLHDVTDIASSLLRELDAIVLATNFTVFMERDTYPRHCLFHINPRL